MKNFYLCYHTYIPSISAICWFLFEKIEKKNVYGSSAVVVFVRNANISKNKLIQYTRDVRKKWYEMSINVKISAWRIPTSLWYVRLVFDMYFDNFTKESGKEWSVGHRQVVSCQMEGHRESEAVDNCADDANIVVCMCKYRSGKLRMRRFSRIAERVGRVGSDRTRSLFEARTTSSLNLSTARFTYVLVRWSIVTPVWKTFIDRKYPAITTRTRVSRGFVLSITVVVSSLSYRVYFTFV